MSTKPNVVLARALARVGTSIGHYTLLSFEGFRGNRPLYAYNMLSGEIRIATLHSIQTSAKCVMRPWKNKN